MTNYRTVTEKDRRPDVAAGGRTLAYGADVHRAQQGAHSRLPARRDDGPAVVCRRRVSAAHGRAADTRDRPDAERRADLVDRSWGHAAVDAGGPECGHLRRAAQGLRGGRHSRLRSASWRRHRVVHAVPRRRAHAGPQRQLDAGSGRNHRRRVREGRRKCRRDSATASTRAIRAPAGCSRWRSSSSSKASTSGCCAPPSARSRRALELFGRALPVNVDGAIAAICADLGFAYELGNAIFLISRLPGLIAHAHEERIRHPPMRQLDPKDHDYDGSGERRLPEGRK